MEITSLAKRKTPEGTVSFHLENVYEKANFPSHFNPKEPLNLYGQIKKGIKPSEWRECKMYWLSMLCNDAKEVFEKVNGFTKSHQQSQQRPLCPIDLTDKLKVHRAWFFAGYSKGKLVSQRHLETEIIGLLFHPEKKALEIKVANAVEINCRIHN